MATTLNQLWTNVGSILGLDSEVASTDDQALVTYYANEAVRQVLMETNCTVTSATVTPGANADYTLTTSMLALRDLYFTSGGLRYMLEPTSMDEILWKRRATGASGPVRNYALAGNTLLMFYPTPAAADELTMYYVPVPTEMSASAHDASSSTYGGIPAAIFDAVENYVLWKCADADDDTTSDMGDRYRGAYEMSIRNARKYLRGKSGYRLSPARLRARRRTAPNPSTSPAVY